MLGFMDLHPMRADSLWSVTPAQASSGGVISATAEIARLALFLSTPSARHITGRALHVGRGTARNYG
jgi:hypothetical protein